MFVRREIVTIALDSISPEQPFRLRLEDNPAYEHLRRLLAVSLQPATTTPPPETPLLASPIGQVQPVLLIQLGKDPSYIILDGHERVEALRKSAHRTVQAQVLEVCKDEWDQPSIQRRLWLMKAALDVLRLPVAKDVCRRLEEILHGLTEEEDPEEPGWSDSLEDTLELLTKEEAGGIPVLPRSHTPPESTGDAPQHTSPPRGEARATRQRFLEQSHQILEAALLHPPMPTEIPQHLVETVRFVCQLRPGTLSGPLTQVLTFLHLLLSRLLLPRENGEAPQEIYETTARLLHTLGAPTSVIQKALGLDPRTIRKYTGGVQPAQTRRTPSLEPWPAWLIREARAKPPKQSLETIRRRLHLNNPQEAALVLIETLACHADGDAEA